MNGASDPAMDNIPPLPDDLPPLRAVIAQHNLRAEKSLGQNFILDGNVTDRIARAAGDLAGLQVVEIGPGPGGLTRSILRARAKSVTALEFDPRAVAALQDLVAASHGRLRVVAGDALETDIAVLVPEGPCVIVANLPYNIATPLLVGWLRVIAGGTGKITAMTLMFQREVAERIVARPGTKTYGRLAVLCQWLCVAKRTHDVPASAFVPPPKITSSVVHFVPRAHNGPQPAFATLENLTAAAFGQRRKMLRSALRGYEDVLGQAGIDPSLRAEQLTVDDFIRLALLVDARDGRA